MLFCSLNFRRPTSLALWPESRYGSPPAPSLGRSGPAQDGWRNVVTVLLQSMQRLVHFHALPASHQASGQK